MEHRNTASPHFSQGKLCLWRCKLATALTGFQPVSACCCAAVNMLARTDNLIKCPWTWNECREDACDCLILPPVF